MKLLSHPLYDPRLAFDHFLEIHSISLTGTRVDSRKLEHAHASLKIKKRVKNQDATALYRFMEVHPINARAAFATIDLLGYCDLITACAVLVATCGYQTHTVARFAGTDEDNVVKHLDKVTDDLRRLGLLSDSPPLAATMPPA